MAAIFIDNKNFEERRSDTNFSELKLKMRAERNRESGEKIRKKREGRREKRSGEQRREKAAESHIQTATGDGECTSHFCWRHFIFRYWHAPVSFICFVCFVIIQKFDKMFTLRIPE